MKYTTIKGFRDPVARLVFGTSWFTFKDAEYAYEQIDRYIEEGGNILDTGRFYGRADAITKAEEVLAGWIAKPGNREKVYIVDKCCHPFVRRNGTIDDSRWRVKPDFMWDDLYYSLDRLGIDYMDMYITHRDDPKIPVSDIMDTFEEMRLKGLIHAYGVSNWQKDRVQEAIDYCNKMSYYGPSINSPSFCPITVPMRRWRSCTYADEEYAMWHKDAGITLFGWAPTGSGFFSGRAPYGEDTSTMPLDVLESYCTPKNLQIRERVREVAKNRDITPTMASLAWVYTHDLDVCAIVGTRTMENLLNSINVIDNIRLTPAEMDYIGLRTDSL